MTESANGAYLDDMGFLVDIGTQVGFKELCGEPDQREKSYIVLDLPDWGNMVEITEIAHLSGEWGEYVLVDPDRTILVEPWKLGAI